MCANSAGFVSFVFVPLGFDSSEKLCIDRIPKDNSYMNQADKVSENISSSVLSWTFSTARKIIMGYRFVKYMKMNTNELDRMLTQQGVPPLRVQEIVETVTDQKKTQRKAKAHKQQMDLQWGEFMAPLVHEHKTIRSIQRYKGSPERTDALEAYALVLHKLKERLYLLMRDKNKTPLQLYPERTHWSDYVPAAIRDEVQLLFDAIPYKAKAKVKIPFARTIPAILHNKRRERLLRSTRKALDRAQSEYAITPSDENAHEVSRIKEALRIIRDMGMNEPVPATWHGFFKVEGE
jgi:hypothetical protein